MSPSDYVLRTRLLLARRMLDQSTASVGEVAVTCGFYDQSHFTKAFKAHTGLPPQAYRQRSVARAARGQ
jgi:transcriptional regulator GlxA family with amidase domain